MSVIFIRKGSKHTPESCEKMSKSRIGCQNALGHTVSEEARKKISEANKGKQSRLGIKHTDETKQKISLARLGKSATWNIGIFVSDETRKKMSDARKGKEPWNKGKKNVYSKETLKVMSDKKVGDKAPNWRGGKSFEPYCEKFNNPTKKSVRDKYDHKCYICGTPETNEQCHVHHIDYNKMQGCGKRSWNLVPLCHACHNKTGHNRWYWFNMLYNHWAIRSEINLGDEKYEIY